MNRMNAPDFGIELPVNDVAIRHICDAFERAASECISAFGGRASAHVRR